MTVRVAIVGRQFGQRVLAPAFKKAGAEVAALYGRRDWRAAIFDPTVDAVAIAVPGAAQEAIALEALKRRKPLFCEKPLSSNLDSANRICSAARRARKPCVVDFEFPETRAWLKAKEFVGHGLGRLRHACVVWKIETAANLRRGSRWKRRSASGGGTLNIFGSHLFHNVEWLFGRVAKISAAIRKDGPGDSSADMLLILASGASVSVALAADAFMGSGHRIEAYGDDGCFVLDNPHADYMTGFSLKVAKRRAPRWRAVVQGRPARRGEDGRIKPVSRLAARFVAAVRTGRKTEPGLAAGLRAQRLIDAAHRSDRTGRVVEVGRGA